MRTRPLVRVIDDNEEMRRVIVDLFAGVGIETVAFEVGTAFFDNDTLERPGCLIADVRMPGMSGLEVQRRAAELAPHLPVILMTGYGEVEMGVEAMKAGAFDFLEKPVSLQRLLDVASKAIEQSVARQKANKEAHVLLDLYNALSEREVEVATSIAEGKPNKLIASDLGISEKTVEFHRANIVKKMQAKGAADLIRKLLLVQSTLP